MAGIVAENYQLKWHSHGTYLHNSVATLYRSDNFADVTLVTSDGRYLTAHRFVLSACSSYLNRVLQISLVKTIPNTVIVMPPEISYRTLAILLQYMYSGEATVSNEQLSGVLKAGEILRIKGLCREKGHNDNNIPLLQKAASNQINGERQGTVHLRNVEKAPDKCQSSASSPNGNTSYKIALPTKFSKYDDHSKVVNDKPSESRSQTPKSDKGTYDRGNDEVSIEENMKIELLVKEEPFDWNDEEIPSAQDDMSEAEVRIKTESLSDNECGENDEYAPLTCDMCHETFRTPALWVRHIETHPITDIPRRKRRRQEDGDEGDEEEYPELRCELCDEVFSTPADWVRHIQGEHTEGQLAVANKISRSSRRASSRAACPSCAKTFPSIASMLIHSRTHTGERPFVCDICDKGFNVKSNLLRHLRTLHDHFIDPV